MRGSLSQALPIGCMRVFITPSCRSVVMWDSRCSGAVNSLSSWPRTICSSWLRVSTSSRHQRHQVFEQFDIDADGLGGDRGFLGLDRLAHRARRLGQR